MTQEENDDEKIVVFFGLNLLIFFVIFMGISWEFFFASQKLT